MKKKTEKIEKKTKELYLNVDIGCSPCVKITFEENCDIDADDVENVVQRIKDRVISAFDCGGEIEFCLREPRVEIHPRTDMVPKTDSERHKGHLDRMEALWANPIKIKSNEEVIAENPDKDKAGYWLVDGIRHSSLVLANNAFDALAIITKDGHVGVDWESPSFTYLGEKPTLINI